MRSLTKIVVAGFVAVTSLHVHAGQGTDVVVGSIIGGAAGAAIGNGFGGRDGAIVGSVIGAAAGVAIASENNDRDDRYVRHDDTRYQRDDYRYRDDRYRDDRRYGYDRRYDRYPPPRQVVVVESPRHYYRGNDFVYGYPSDYYNRPYYGYDRGPTVVVVQPQPRYHDRGRGHGHRRW